MASVPPRETPSRRAAAIPEQLQQPQFRFVLIPRGSKAPCEKGWNTLNNYRFNDPKLIRWLQQGGNYGVCCGFGDLVGIDSDDPVVAERFENNFGSTFRVRSGSGRGFHDYAIVHGLTEKLLFERHGKHLGEAQSLGQQLVGPGSVHPSGGIYRIVRNAPIVELDSESFLKAFTGLLKPVVKATKAHAAPRSSNSLGNYMFGVQWNCCQFNKPESRCSDSFQCSVQRKSGIGIGCTSEAVVHAF